MKKFNRKENGYMHNNVLQPKIFVTHDATSLPYDYKVFRKQTHKIFSTGGG